MRSSLLPSKRLKNEIFQSRDLCLRALDTNSVCAKSVRRNEGKMQIKQLSEKGKMTIIKVSHFK